MEVHMKSFRIIILSLILAGFAGSKSIAQVLESPRDNFYDKIWIEEKKPVPYPFVREADVLWAKTVWQVLDMREKINQPLYFPVTPMKGRHSLMQVIMDGVKKGQITPYDPMDDEFLRPLNPEDVEALLVQQRTMQIEREDGSTMDTTFRVAFNTADVKKFRIKESWFFDSKRSVMEVRILGICPVRDNIDPTTGEIRGDQPLFWIYFPEARNVFVNHEVFNRFNDAQRMSYDDLFIRRMFNSFIYKESNVYERRISDYYTGLDALLEADKIKNDIRILEHDLWEY